MSIEMTGLADIVRQHAAVRPDAAAIVHAGRTSTYAALDRASIGINEIELGKTIFLIGRPWLPRNPAKC